MAGHDIIVVGASAGDADPTNGLRHEEPLGLGTDGHVVTDTAGVILEANPKAATLLQCPREFLIGKPLGLFVTEGFRSAFYERLARRRHADHSEVFETRLGRVQERAHDVIVMLSATAGEEGRAAGCRWLIRDVSATRRIEQALRAERQLLDSVIDAAQAIILVLDDEGHILRSNPYLHAVAGRGPHELHGRRWHDVLLDPAERHALQKMVFEAMTYGLARSGVLPLPSRSGQRRDVIWSARGLPGGVSGAVVLLGHDVTDLQEAQRQALQAERLAAIGQMATGLAHESRNALQRMQACLSMLALRAQGNPDSLDLIERAQKAQDDLSRLFEDVRSYAAALHLERGAADLSAVWREAWADVVALHGQAGAELREDAAGTSLSCAIDAFQIKRVFRNLFENALAACPDPARVVVRCGPAELGDRAALEVRVRDNGPGFPPGLRHRLFEPFFTTKTRGTGLGLAICRRIVQAHGGQIEAAEGGPGAEIRITLPRRTS